jgi:hypothetical protein
LALTKGDKGAYSMSNRFQDIGDGVSNVVLFAEGYAICQGTIRFTFQPPRFHNFGLTGSGKPSDDPSFGALDYTGFQLQPAQCDPWRSQSGHRAMPIALMDGSVHQVEAGIAADAWRHALKPNDDDQ